MTTNPDDASLDALDALLGKAVPLPWEQMVADDAEFLRIISEDAAKVEDRVAGLIYSRADPGAFGKGVTVATMNARRATIDRDKASAALIVAAVNALPGLIATIRDLRKRDGDGVADVHGMLASEALLRLCEALGIAATPMAYLEVPAILARTPEPREGRVDRATVLDTIERNWNHGPDALADAILAALNPEPEA